LGKLRANRQTLDQAGKAYQDQTHKFISSFIS
jgi:hypothetical protein